MYFTKIAQLGAIIVHALGKSRVCVCQGHGLDSMSSRALLTSRKYFYAIPQETVYQLLQQSICGFFRVVSEVELESARVYGFTNRAHLR